MPESAHTQHPGAHGAVPPGSQPSNGDAHAAHRNDEHDDGGGHAFVVAQRGTGKWIVVFVLLLGAALGGAFLLVRAQRAATESDLQSQTADAAAAPQSVDVVQVAYGPSTRVLPLPGQCSAWYETTIYARVSGYLQKWNVDIGDHVKEGQVLATIETPELDQQLAADQSKVKAAQAQVELATANADFSRTTKNRYENAPKGVVSELERDQRIADNKTSDARVDVAKSDLASAQSDVDRVNAMIAFRQVTAPFGGIITQRHVDIGDLVTAGSTASTSPLFNLAQSDQIRVFVDVPQSTAPDIHNGDSATILADEYPDRQFAGRVARNAGSINNEAKTLRVEVDVPNADFALLPGMFVKVNFEIHERRQLLQVPASALNFRSGGPQVALVNKDGHIVFRKVSIALDMGESVEIKDGLSPDDRVALNISSQVADGDAVKPNEVELPTPAGAPAAPRPVASAGVISPAH